DAFLESPGSGEFHFWWTSLLCVVGETAVWRCDTGGIALSMRFMACLWRSHVRRLVAPGLTSAATVSTQEELDVVLERSTAAAPILAALSPVERAGFLRAIADALDGAAEELVPIAMAESHYPEARCRNELARTTFQLRLFADVVEEGSYLEAHL